MTFLKFFLYFKYMLYLDLKMHFILLSFGYLIHLTWFRVRIHLLINLMDQGRAQGAQRRAKVGLSIPYSLV
jgi:hypothetical protein